MRRNKIAGLMGVAQNTHRSRKPTKIQGMMGAAPDEIAKKLFSTGDYVLEPPEYAVLWNNVSPARFITRCIKFLLDYEKSPDDVAKALKKDKAELQYFITCILHSITVFDLFSIMDERSQALNTALDKFDALKKKNPQPNDKRIYKVLSALHKHKKPPYEVGVVSMVVDCAALVPLPLTMGFSMPGIKAGSSKNVKPTYALEDIDEEFPFLFPFLQNLLTCSDSQTQGSSSPAVAAQQIFHEILKILTTLHHQLRMAPESIESVSVQALALMFMLKQFLAVSPTSDLFWLDEAVKVISSFKAWPLPFSATASDLLKMLDTEIKAPGSYLREKLMLEDPELLPSSHVANPDDVHVLQVHVLVDREDPLSNTHQALFETVQQERGRKSSNLIMINEDNADEEGEAGESRGGEGSGSFNEDYIDLTPEHLRIRMVTHIISCDYDLSTATGSSSTDDPLNLVSRTPEQMLEFYEKALAIHAKAKTLPTQDTLLLKSERGVSGGICKLYRENAIDALLTEICPGHSFRPVRSGTEEGSGRKSDSMAMSFSMKGMGSAKSLLQVESEKEEVDENAESVPERPEVPAPDYDVKKVEPFNNTFTPLMPPVQFKFWQCKTTPISKPTATQVTENRYLYYKAECEQLKTLVEATVEKSPPGVKPVLKLVLMGSNLILHKYLCAYSAVYESEPDLLQKVHLRLYICPEGQNDLGRFLAWSDAWYKRHVFSPFVGAVPLAPQYAINETFPASLLDECSMHSTLPVNLLREMLQHYVRCAEHTENIKVYDVQCWTEEDKKLRRLSTTDSFLDADGDYDLFGNDSGKKARASVEEKMPIFALTPSVLVPFITSIEIGILSQVEAYKFNMMKQDEGLKQILSDKEFIKNHGGGDFPPLSISYRPTNLGGKATKEEKEISGEFVSISICNVPEGIRDFETSMMEEKEKFGTWSGLTLAVRRNQGKLKDLLHKKSKLSSSEVDAYVETMKSQDSFGIQSLADDIEEDPHAAKMLMVGTVTVQVTKQSDSFYILADGALVGPLKKISVGPSALKHKVDENADFQLPVQSFFAVAAFDREEDA